MSRLRDWAVFSSVFVRYGLYRVGLSRKVPFTEHPQETIASMGSILQWDRRLRVEGAVHCPKCPPAIFACNHVRLNDPMYVWPAIYRGSGEKIISGFMMRNDFFGGRHWRWAPVDMNELCEMAGAVLISRRRFQLTQMRPLLEMLGRPGAFMMFPGGTRTRSGLAMEYHDGLGEPGAVSFFLAHAQRRYDRAVPAVPVFRTPNFATGRGVVTFGPPVYLDSSASRAGQRAFDAELAVRIAELVEVNALHAVGAILYLRGLHGLNERMPMEELRGAVRRATSGLPEVRIDPALINRLDEELRHALRYFEAHGMLERRGEDVLVRRAAVLSCPRLNTSYRKHNPVKYFTNQILHVPALVRRLEEIVL